MAALEACCQFSTKLHKFIKPCPASNKLGRVLEVLATWVGTVFAVAAFILAAVIAVRGRQLTRPILRFSFGLSAQDENSLFSTFKRGATCVFVLIEDAPAGPFVVPIPFQITNPSEQLITNATVQFEMQKDFFVKKTSMEEQFDKVQEHFSEHATERDSIKKLREIREETFIRDIAIARYSFGNVQPGAPSIISAESINVRRATSFDGNDARFSGYSYPKIYRAVRNIPGVIDHCVISATVSSDQISLGTWNVSVVVIDDTIQVDFAALARRFSRAHWFEGYPRPGAYRTTHFAPWRRVPNPLRAELAWKGYFKYSVIRTKRLENSVVVMAGVDFPPTQSDFLELWMPGFDYYRQPKSVDTMQASLRAMGVVRSPTVSKLFSILWRDLKIRQKKRRIE